MKAELFSRVLLNERDLGFSAASIVPLGEKSLVFVSGEIGRDASGALVSGDFEAEVRQCFANIGRALSACGASMPDVVRITAYLKDLSEYSIYAKVRNEVFGNDWPASASVGVSDLLLGARIEVDAVAVIASAAPAAR